MQKLNLTKRQLGFTTVELMIVVALVGILNLAVYGAASTMRRSFAPNTKNNYNLLAAKKGLSRIAEEIRYASGMSTPTPGKTQFAFPGGTTTMIYLDNGSLCIQKPGVTTSIPEPLVQSVTFTLNNSRVTASVVVKDKSSLTNPTLTLRTTVRMLNASE